MIFLKNAYIYKKILVVNAFIVLVIAGFEYYHLEEWTLLKKSLNRIIIIGINKTSSHESSPGMEAEKDSQRKKESVIKVCQKYNVTNVMEVKVNRRNRRKLLWQRYNLLEHLLVNEERKVLFCYIPKISCTNIQGIFAVMDGLYPSVEKVNFTKLHTQVLRLSNRNFTRRQRKYMLKNYNKFMLVRDPFERLVSAYRDKFQNKKNIKSWAHLGKHIIKKYRYNNTNSKTINITGLDVSFNEYAQYLIDNPPWMVNEHWAPYEELCRPCEVKYDFIGSIDNLDRDVAHAMTQIHANNTKYHVLHPSGALTKTKQATANFLKNLSRKHFDQLLDIFKTDHELFGYPLPDYDTLDKRYPA